MAGTGFSIPVEERIAFYYSLGHGVADIARIVSSEYQEFELHPITEQSVALYIRKNTRRLYALQQDAIAEIRAKNAEELGKSFSVAQHAELSIASAYSKKIIEMVNELDALDITERTKEGHFKNMGAYCTLVLSINKTQEMLEKISGTKAAREVMVHMKKAFVKEAAAKGMGMHKAAAEMEVTFMDDETVTALGPSFKSDGVPTLKKLKG